MFDTTDPRTALQSGRTSAPRDAGDAGIASAQFIELDQGPPAVVSDAGSSTWYVRGQNFVLEYTHLKAGDSLARSGQEHEYVVLLSQRQGAIAVAAGQEREEIAEPAIVVVPPGDSEATAVVDTDVVRLFDARTKDLLDRAANAQAYADPDRRVAPLEPWPPPAGGHRLRVYPTDDIPPQEGRFGRIFRTSALMVNVLDPQEGPRDPEKLSPHDHDDFEQCSLVVEGEYVHHIRTPWTPRRSHWREDEHRHVGSPSVTIIPPPTVHTSEAVGAGRNQLIDIFCPPRADFSARPGWVLNADDYPAPS